MRRHLLAFAALLAAAVPALGAGVAAPPAPAAVPTAPAAASAIESRLAGAVAGCERLLSVERLRAFYAARSFRPAWGNGGPSAQADALVAALRAAGRDGLRPEDYHTAAIEGLLAKARGAPGAPGAAPSAPAPARLAEGDAADLDLLLTDAFFLYAGHLTAGRVRPESVEPEWNIEGRGRDLGLLLGAALDGAHLATTLAELPPARRDYRLLRDALATQRAVAAAGGWPVVPWGPALRAGSRGPRVVALRRRLAATGELAAGSDTTGEVLDEPLAAALRRFQERHGIEPDGVAGKRTLSELNTPATLRVSQIVANLERLRWLPRELGPRHILVNVADFRLALTEGGAQTLAMRVIAGREARRTPFFTGEITSILLNPTWTVPDKIAREDKVPLILADPDFLSDNGFKVYDRKGGAWREVDPLAIDLTRVSEKSFPYRLVQGPGPKNALGRIKFQVPNRHDIYLHDTPSRGLFARAERGYSSGCIRVERPLDLAERLLADDPAWPRAKIEATLATTDTVKIRVPQPIPVYLLYWTAWVDEGGLLQYREDLYGRDAAILEALAKPLAAP